MNLAYLYQKPMFAVLPNEAMGNFDFCRHAELYTPGSTVKTHYCSLTHDRGGVCVPTACTAEDLHSQAILQPLMALGTEAAATVRACVAVRFCLGRWNCFSLPCLADRHILPPPPPPPPPKTLIQVPAECFMNTYISRECAASRQAWEYYQTLYNDLALLGQDTPKSHGTVSCDVRGPEPDTAAYFMVYLTAALAALAVWGAGWTYLYSQGKVRSGMVGRGKERAVDETVAAYHSILSHHHPAQLARKKRDDSRKQREVTAAALPLPSPGFQPVAVTVEKSPGACVCVYMYQ